MAEGLEVDASVGGSNADRTRVLSSHVVVLTTDGTSLPPFKEVEPVFASTVGRRSSSFAVAENLEHEMRRCTERLQTVAAEKSVNAVVGVRFELIYGFAPGEGVNAIPEGRLRQHFIVGVAAVGTGVKFI